MDAPTLLAELDAYGFEDIVSAEKVRILNDVRWDFCSREAWPFLEKEITLTFNGSSAAPTNLPSDFRAVLALVNTTSGYGLDPERYDTILKKYGSRLTDVGDPIVYFFLAGQLRVWKVPSSSTTLLMPYIHKPPAITSTSTEGDMVVPKEHHWAFVDGALAKLYDQSDDPEMAARFEAKYENRIQTARGELWGRQFDRPERVHMLELDPFDYLD